MDNIIILILLYITHHVAMVLRWPTRAMDLILQTTEGENGNLGNI